MYYKVILFLIRILLMEEYLRSSSSLVDKAAITEKFLWLDSHGPRTFITNLSAWTYFLYACMYI